VIVTTGNFKSADLLRQESDCALPKIDLNVAQEIGAIAVQLGTYRNLGIVISIRFDEWEVFKAALPGSKPENDGWINRKANVVNLKHHSTMYERVKAEEEGIDWHQANGVTDITHAIHGGGFPLISKSEGFKGALLISGLPQVDDHLLAVEILEKYLKSA
jgi:uncharacterized protein (UPF0303 family)